MNRGRISYDQILANVKRKTEEYFDILNNVINPKEHRLNKKLVAMANQSILFLEKIDNLGIISE